MPISIPQPKRHYFAVVLINSLVLALVFSILEIGFRLAYPEFEGQIYSRHISKGKRIIHGKYLGQVVRTPTEDFRYDDQRPHIVVLGDSISDGHGQPYEDIYWVRMQRLLDRILPSERLQTVSFAQSGNSLVDSVDTLQSIASRPIDITAIVYQFNFNDITPYSRMQLSTPSNNTHRWKTTIIRQFNQFRYSVLNRSVFLRVVQHYAGIWKTRTSGTCHERGLDALGSYSWAFGSLPLMEESEKAWANFENDFDTLYEITRKLGVPLYVLVSPLLYDIDKQGIHRPFNHRKLDFDCATIDPRLRLKELSERPEIIYLDPTDYVRHGFESRIKEGNFEPFYFTADDNHFRPIMSTYITEVIFTSILERASRGKPMPTGNKGDIIKQPHHQD